MIIIDIRLCTIYVLHWICDRRKNLWSEFCRIKITSLFVSSVVLGKIVLCQMINSFVPFNLKNKSQKKKLILKAVQSIWNVNQLTNILCYFIKKKFIEQLIYLKNLWQFRGKVTFSFLLNWSSVEVTKGRDLGKYLANRDRKNSIHGD